MKLLNKSISHIALGVADLVVAPGDVVDILDSDWDKIKTYPNLVHLLDHDRVEVLEVVKEQQFAAPAASKKSKSKE